VAYRSIVKINLSLWALGTLGVLGACDAGASPRGTTNTIPDLDPRDVDEADDEPAGMSERDASRGGLDAGGRPRGDATLSPSDATLERSDATAPDTSPKDAAASPPASGLDGAVTSSDAAAPAARVPSFKKTRCIDPSKVEPGKELNFPCDGIDIWVVVPPQCSTRACGVVFNIHGGGMSDHATMDQATDMIALGSKADYIVVHPHKGTWSVARDKDAVYGFLQQVSEAFDVDKKRVHSTGYSQGGQISWALGCEHADVVASIAPAEEINRVTDCWKTPKLPVRELPVLFAYGRRDSIGGGYAAAETLVEQFVKAHDMKGPDTLAGTEASKYWRQRWTSESGNVLEFITQDYTSTGVGGILNGHCLPMSAGKTFVSCSLPVDYDWGAEVIEFFKAHPLP
jgi:polyhydroxybutyrate depolymerase